MSDVMTIHSNPDPQCGSNDCGPYQYGNDRLSRLKPASVRLVAGAMDQGAAREVSTGARGEFDSPSRRGLSRTACRLVPSCCR
jgi:hypothetical protein